MKKIFIGLLIAIFSSTLQSMDEDLSNNIGETNLNFPFSNQKMNALIHAMENGYNKDTSHASEIIKQHLPPVVAEKLPCANIKELLEYCSFSSFVLEHQSTMHSICKHLEQEYKEPLIKKSFFDLYSRIIFQHVGFASYAPAKHQELLRLIAAFEAWFKPLELEIADSTNGTKIRLTKNLINRIKEPSNTDIVQ